MECILKSKITFIGNTSFEYYLISVKNRGKSVSMEKLSREDALSYIKENNFIEEFSNQDGKVYSDGKFKAYMDTHPLQKKALYYVDRNFDSPGVPNTKNL